MANNKTKTLILITATALAVGGVLTYAKTRVEPPLASKTVDAYALDMTNRIMQSQIATDYETNQRNYGATAHRAALFAANGRLDDKAYAGFRNSNDSIYADRLAMETFEIFGSSQWNDNRLAFLESQMNRLASKDDKTMSFATQEKITEAGNVMNDYRNARRACQVSFVSLPDAEAKIATARQFLAYPWLCNNRQLTESLRAVPGKLANGHYNQLQSACNRLLEYRSCDNQDIYDNVMYNPYSTKLKEYKATDVYGSHKRDCSQIERSADQYYSWAREYFNGN